MFSRWGAFVYRHRRIVLVLAIVVGVAGCARAPGAPPRSSRRAAGWIRIRNPPRSPTGSPTSSAPGAGRSSPSTGAPRARTRAGQPPAAIAASLTDIASDPDVSGTIGFAETGDARFISTDGQSAYVVIDLNVSDEASVPLIDRFESELHQPGDGIELLLGGYARAHPRLDRPVQQDLLRAETVSRLPIAAFVLILVFTSLVAAGIPLLVAGLAIPTTLALVWIVGQQVEMSVYVSNVSTMLGLALAIDYSLFMVSRFREELKKGRSVGNAVEIAVATSGKAVTFSGLAVAIGLGGLLVFNAPALRSFGIGGMLTVFSALFYAMTFLPALLGILGPRINSLSVGGLFDRVRRAFGMQPREAAAAARQSRWVWIANTVMAHPVVVIIPTLALLLLAGLPFLRLEQGIPDAYTLPPGLESREAAVAIQRGSRRAPPPRSSPSSTWPATRRPRRTCAPWPPTAGSSPPSRAWSASRARSPGSPIRPPGSR